MTVRAARNLVLAGFMGAGKSTVGRIVAWRLGLAFVDTDAEIERRVGRSIAQIFAGDGETAFRRIEAQVCHEVAAGRDQVIAVGGGALLDESTRRAFAQTGLIVCLTCALDESLRRVGDDPARPLFSADRARLTALYAARAAHYASLPHAVDTTARAPAEIAEEVIRLWNRPLP
ncbi:MAG: shikimate kinase [Anaerolineae bacterium]|nr:shikimate kinase [Anaerolineae bacterium]